MELIVSGESPPSSENSSPPTDEILSLVEGLERIRSAGIWAVRHASPDLIGQLNQVVARPIDTLICTILDSDASLRLNAAIAARFSERVVGGVSLLAKITGVRRTVLAVESFAAPPWMTPLSEAANRAGLQIVDLANEYPQSDPTLMVYSLTHRRLRPGSLPTTRRSSGAGRGGGAGDRKRNVSRANADGPGGGSRSQESAFAFSGRSRRNAD